MKVPFYNAYVGSASGIFKGVYAVHKSNLFVKNIDGLKNATNKNPITSMSWCDGAEDEIMIGYGSQLVKVYNVQSKTFTFSDDRKFGEGPIVGVSKFKGLLMSAVESGIVRMWRENDVDVITIESGGHLDRMRHKDGVIATGGKENDLKLWDIHTGGKKLFAAKNVRHDELELRVPIWVTDIAFIPDSKKVAVTTKHGHVRVYDPSTPMRRPVVNVQVPEQALTCIAYSYKDHHVIVGSGTGQMNLVDLRSKGLVMNKYKGFVGGIKSVGCSLSEPYIVSVSLDRHFRIHHLLTKELLFKEYMQSKLACVLVKSNFDLTPENYNSDEDLVSDKEEKEESAGEEETVYPTLNLNTGATPEKRIKSSSSPKKKHKS
uniref:Putative wd repeat domain 74 n=1 Tax=Triatoma infestans TaxID=30076 RepID=A0A023FA33_TRIIF